MPAPENRLKAKLTAGQVQKGLWLALASPAAAELAAHAGFDWCLIDAEHGPNDLVTIQSQLHAMNGAPAEAVVRVPAGKDWMLKRVLDLGAQSVLIPMIDTADQAAHAVAACRYPPQGRRGVGAALGRASGYNAIGDYTVTANAQICVMVQVESKAGIDNLDAIARTDGVDVVFVGPADLAADMGYPGDLRAPEVVQVVEQAIARITALGKIAGIVDFDPATLPHYVALGVRFLGLGSDVTSLGGALRDLARRI